MRIVDLTHRIETNMPVFPGDDAPELKPFATYESHGFRETLLSFCSHTGTHMDPPSHVFPQGKTLDEFSPEQFIGSALVVDCTSLEPREPISLDLIQQHEPLLSEADFLLFHTGWSNLWGKQDYFCDYPCLSKDAVDFILQSGKKGIGMDTAGVDPIDDDSLVIHKSLLGQGDFLLIENMRNLDLVGPGLFTLIALPLYVSNADGAPARVIGIFEE